MNRNVFILIVTAIVGILLFSCHPGVCTHQITTVSNMTSDDYLLIIADHPDIRQNKIDKVFAFEDEKIIRSKVEVLYEPSVGMPIYDVWLYNISDSTYINISKANLIDDYEDNVKFSQSENEYEKYENNSVMLFSLNIIVDSSIQSQMTKNTALTDSIFRLK